MKPTMRTGRTSLALCLLLLASTAAQAQAPVWAIEKDGGLMYLGGTLHLLTPRDYPLPSAIETAYRQAERVVFETDIGKLKKPSFQQYMLQQLSYADGGNLRQVLSDDTYQGLIDFFSARGVPMTEVDRYKPGMVAMLMTLIKLQRPGVVAVGVDDHFNARLQQDDKEKGELETAGQQVEFIASLGAGNADALLSYNLADIARLPQTWQALTRAWRKGDLATLDALAAAPMRREFPQIYTAILVERNDAWLPRLEAMARSPRVELVLVGALHLSGEDGLLAQLAARGFSFRQLP